MQVFPQIVSIITLSVLEVPKLLSLVNIMLTSVSLLKFLLQKGITLVKQFKPDLCDMAYLYKRDLIKHKEKNHNIFQ